MGQTEEGLIDAMRCQGWLLLVLIALGPPLAGCRSDASISRPGGMLATTSRPTTAAAESREATSARHRGGRSHG
jgi:hypothetical protein